MDQTLALTALGGPELQAFATGFPILLAHVGVTLLMLMAGAVLYAVLTPWKEISLIRNGNSTTTVGSNGVTGPRKAPSSSSPTVGGAGGASAPPCRTEAAAATASSPP